MNATDTGTIANCRYIADAAKHGLPKGETPELFAEIIAAHIRCLASTKQFVGKSVLRMELSEMQKKWPVVPFEKEAL